MRRQDGAQAAVHMGPPCTLLEKGHTKTTICLKVVTSFQALCSFFSTYLCIILYDSRNLSIFLVTSQINCNVSNQQFKKKLTS